MEEANGSVQVPSDGSVMPTASPIVVEEDVPPGRAAREAAALAEAELKRKRDEIKSVLQRTRSPSEADWSEGLESVLDGEHVASFLRCVEHFKKKLLADIDFVVDEAIASKRGGKPARGAEVIAHAVANNGFDLVVARFLSDDSSQTGVGRLADLSAAAKETAKK